MPEPSGEIREMSVAWLFQDVCAGKKTGTAIFESDGIVKKVYFSNGNILSATSTGNDDRLGEFLLKIGRITQAQFNASSAETKKTGKQLGAVLFEMNILAPKELVSQVKAQAKQVILDLFRWRSGTYRFDEGQKPDPGIVPLPMNTTDLILEGLQALDWQFIRKILPPTGKVLRPVIDRERIFQETHLSQDQKAVLALIDGSRTIEQICLASGIGDFNALKAIHLLLATRMAEVCEGAGTGQKGTSAARAQEADPDENEPEIKVTRAMLLDAYHIMKHQDHFQVLGINATTSQAEIKKTYFRLAKRYHPDRHTEPDMADMKDKLEALFARITDAYQTLGNEERRREYEQSKPSVDASHFQEKRAEDYVENYAEKTGRAASYFNSGMKDFKVGNFWGAADAFAWATRLDPVKAPYFYYFGLALMKIPRRRHEAEESLQKAIEIDPLREEYHLELGGLYLKSGLKAKAAEVFTAALQANPFSEKIAQAVKAAGGGEEAPKGDPEGSGGLFKKMFKDKK